jgi:hypothetical protein
MQYLKSFVLINLLWLMPVVCAQPMNRPAPQKVEFSGTVYAPQGGDVAGTYVVACYVVDETCDQEKSFDSEVVGSGANGTFTLLELENTQYDVFAVKDVNGDGDFFGDGDYYGEIAGQVTPPQTGLEIQLSVIGSAPATPTTDVNTPEPYIMKGRVTNSAGEPIEGIEVFADNTLLYDSNLVDVTDADGYYRIDLNGFHPSSWQGAAYIETTFEGEYYMIRLEADNKQAFAGVDGAIRNFTWRVSGEIFGGGYHGALAFVYSNFINEWPENYDDSYVKLTFTPQGPLIDGSTGETLVLSPNGGEITDIPIGRYTVTARYEEPGQTPRPLQINLDDLDDVYESSKTFTFYDDALYGPMIEIGLDW